MLDDSNIKYDMEDAKRDFEVFFKKDDSKTFLSTLVNFMKNQQQDVSIENIRNFITDQKETLSKIKDGIENLLIGFVKICVLNNSDDINEFLKLTDEFQIEDVTYFKQRIIWRVDWETKQNDGNANKKKITDFFPTPKDLFSFYAEAYPELLDNKFDKIIDVADNHMIDNTSNHDVKSKEHFDLFDLLQRYDNKQIADFVKSEPVSKGVISLLIWASFFNSVCPWDLKTVFPTIKGLIDFYIYKVPDQLKQKKDFSVFMFLHWFAYTNQGKATGKWENYLKEVSNDKNHISLFFDFFEGKMDFDEEDIRNIVCVYGIFSGFQGFQGFFDFYLKIYSSSSQLDNLKQKNDKRDYILSKIIYEYGRDISRFLLTNGNEEKYKCFIPRLIDIVCQYEYIEMSDFSNIVKFLNQNADLDKSLKNKLLKKIDSDIAKKMEGVKVNYYDKTYSYPEDFKTNLSYIQEIMKSEDILFETKKKIYEWVTNACEKDQKQWDYVLELCVYNIESKKKNDPKFDAKDDKYEYLSEYSHQEYKDLKTLKSHLGEWHLTDLKNSDEVKNLNNQINTIKNQIDATNNTKNIFEDHLSTTEFKFEWNWNLFVWLSGIGTIVRLIQRHLLSQNLLEIKSRIGSLGETKLNLESQKQKFDYEDSLYKANQAMKKWGKSGKNEDYPYDEHTKYLNGLRTCLNFFTGENM